MQPSRVGYCRVPAPGDSALLHPRLLYGTPAEVRAIGHELRIRVAGEVLQGRF